MNEFQKSHKELMEFVEFYARHVFNDNGDMTITEPHRPTSDDCIKAYYIYNRARRAIKYLPVSVTLNEHEAKAYELFKSMLLNANVPTNKFLEFIADRLIHTSSSSNVDYVLKTKEYAANIKEIYDLLNIRSDT